MASVWREPAQLARAQSVLVTLARDCICSDSPEQAKKRGTMRADTLLVHAGEPRPRDGGAVAMPIYQSSTFEETEARGYHDIRYARLSNTPTHEPPHAKPPPPEGAQPA